MDLTTLILATGALGTAAFGIVEGLKGTRVIGEAGFGVVLRLLGKLTQALHVAYGDTWERVLRGQYRGEQRELVRVLRQGVRVGLTAQNAGELARFLGSMDPAALAEAVRRVEAGEELPPALRNVIGRFELAADARIDAALALAQRKYAARARVTASVVAILVALLAAAMLDRSFRVAFLIGVAAVPVAPVAKDLVKALQEATRALKARA